MNRARAAIRWIDAPLAAVDLEMTGLDPARDRICEVGIVTGSHRTIEDQWASLVRPGVSMTPGARKVHGIADAEAAVADPFEAVADEIADRLHGRVCVAHRAEVDRRFLEDAFARCGRTMPEVCWIDTLALARMVLALRSHRLGSLVRGLGVEATPSHRALGDAEAAWGVLHALLDLIDPRAAWTVERLCSLEEWGRPDADLATGREALVRDAHREGYPLRVVYVSRNQEGRWRRTVREVDVLDVKLPKVEVFCHLRDEERVFRLERMHHVRPSDDAELSDVPGASRGGA